MEQLINSMLANVQTPQQSQAVKKSDGAQKDDFQKLMEQKQGTEAPEAPKQEKPEALQEKPQESSKPQEAQEGPEAENPAVPKNIRELENQMALAAMAMMQNPVVPVEEVMTPEVQAEAAAVEIAPVVAEEILTPEKQVLAPEAELSAEIPVEGEQAVDQALVEELPQTVEAPEAPQESQESQEGTVEVRVETHEARPEAAETEKPAEESDEDTPELQDAEVEAPVFKEVKAVPVKVGEAPKTEANQPVEDQIVPKVSEALQSGETRVELQLNPENLGKVTVEMTWKDDGGLVVQIHAENRETQNLLNKNASGLEALLGREVQVEVPRQEESQRQDLYEQQQQQHRHQQQQEERREQRKSHPGDTENFLQQLRLGLIPMEGE